MLVCEQWHVFLLSGLCGHQRKEQSKSKALSSCVLGTGIPHCFPQVHDWNPASLHTGCSREKCLFWALFKEINNLPYDSPQSPLVQELSHHIRSQRYPWCEQELRVRSATCLLWLEVQRPIPQCWGPGFVLGFWQLNCLFWSTSTK